MYGTKDYRQGTSMTITCLKILDAQRIKSQKNSTRKIDLSKKMDNLYIVESVWSGQNDTIMQFQSKKKCDNKLLSRCIYDFHSSKVQNSRNKDDGKIDASFR